MNSRVEAERRAEPPGVDQRREAFAERDRLFAGEAAASARDSATCSARGRPATRASTRAPRQVVAGEQGSAARAEMMPLARIERAGAARTEHSRWVK